MLWVINSDYETLSHHWQPFTSFVVPTTKLNILWRQQSVIHVKMYSVVFYHSVYRARINIQCILKLFSCTHTRIWTCVFMCIENNGLIYSSLNVSLNWLYRWIFLAYWNKFFAWSKKFGFAWERNFCIIKRQVNGISLHKSKL